MLTRVYTGRPSAPSDRLNARCTWPSWVGQHAHPLPHATRTLHEDECTFQQECSALPSQHSVWCACASNYNGSLMTREVARPEEVVQIEGGVKEALYSLFRYIGHATSVFLFKQRQITDQRHPFTWAAPTCLQVTFLLHSLSLPSHPN